MQAFRPLLLLAVLACLGTQDAHGLSIAIDYSADQATENFFSLRPVAKAAVEKAAADINAVLSPTNLSAISSSGSPNANAISGVDGGITITADWDYLYSNPSTGSQTTITNPSFSANAVTIYVGLNALGLGVLGEGAPGGATVNIGGTQTGPGNLNNAVANMQAASNAYIGRGAGPIVSTISGNIGGANFNLTLGAALGTLTLNNDNDNNGVADSLSALDAYWHYDATTSVASGKNDLYSVALHELLHTLGIGSSETWDSMVSGTSWTGANGIAANGGSGANLIYSDGAHIANGVMSKNIYTGLSQEAVMDPSLTVGTRKQLTTLDVAMLKDLGYSVAPVPEPGSALLCIVAFIVTCSVRRSRFLRAKRG